MISSAAALGLAGVLLAAGRTLVVGPGGLPDLATALAEAEDGDRVEVRGGVHRGPFVVERGVELVGVDQPVLDGRREGDVITFLAAGGALEGFVVRNSGERGDREHAGVRAEASVRVEDNVFEDVLYGINLKMARDSLLRGNLVRGRDLDVARRGDGIRIWESHGTVIEDNVVEGGRDVVIWYSERLRIEGNEVRQGRYGLHYMYSHDSEILRNRLERNSVGAFMMYSHGLRIEGNVFAGNHGSSGYGLALKDCDEAEIRGNVLAGNRVGLYLDNTPSRMEVHNELRGNTFAWNDTGVLFMPSVKRNRFAENAFLENVQQVGLSSTGRFEGNEWTPGGRGNYWSNYAGFDEDGDGLGDIEHDERSLFEDLMTERPTLRLFLLSPAQTAVDTAARAFPVFRPPSVLVDSAPLVAAPPPAVSAPTPLRAPLGALALGLLGGGLLVVVWGWRLERPEGRLGREGAA